MPIIRDQAKQSEIVDLLTQAYWMEIETVMSYIAASVNLDGIRAEAVKSSLAEDIPAELEHAQRFAKRIKQLYGQVPGSAGFRPSQWSLQPPTENTEVATIIRGVMDAEQSAIDHYRRLINACGDVDYVTQDIAIDILADEESHLREFEGFLREYEQQAESLSGQPRSTTETDTTHLSPH